MDKSDLLFYFIKKSIDLLKTDGIMGFIVSNAFLFSDKAQKLRNYIIETCSILEIVNFEQYKVFKDADIMTCILILQKNKKTTRSKAYSFKDKHYSENTILETMNDKSVFFEIEFTKDDPFALVDAMTLRLNEKIDAKHPKLGDILHIGKGMETAANDVFSFDAFPGQFSEEYVKIRMSGEIISRYHISEAKEYLLYFEDSKTFEELPQPIREYLSSNRERLEARATVRNEGHAWWRYSRPLHREYYHLGKIWCSYRAKNNAFVLDYTQNFIGLTNTTVIFGNNPQYDLLFILALLNSGLLNFRYKSIGKQTGSGIYEYFENQITKLPIPTVTLEQQMPLTQKAQKMIELNNDFHKCLTSAINYLTTKYSIPSKNLENLHLLGNQEFLKILGKSKQKIPLKDEQILLDWFAQAKTELLAVAEQIQVLDADIDREVYSIYGLSDLSLEEIALIEDCSENRQFHF
jgi:hypothetical protein